MTVKIDGFHLFLLICLAVGLGAAGSSLLYYGDGWREVGQNFVAFFFGSAFLLFIVYEVLDPLLSRRGPPGREGD